MRLCILAACFARGLLHSLPLFCQRGRGKAGRRLAPATRGQERTRAGSRGSQVSPALPHDGLNSLHMFCQVNDALLPSSPSDCRGASKARLNRCVTTRPDASSRAPDHTSASLPRPLRKYRHSLESVLTFEAAQGNVLQCRLSHARPVTGRRLRLNPPPALACPSRAPALSASTASCPAISDGSRFAPLIGQDEPP